MLFCRKGDPQLTLKIWTPNFVPLGPLCPTATPPPVGKTFSEVRPDFWPGTKPRPTILSPNRPKIDQNAIVGSFWLSGQKKCQNCPMQLDPAVNPETGKQKPKPSRLDICQTKFGEETQKLPQKCYFLATVDPISEHFGALRFAPKKNFGPAQLRQAGPNCISADRGGQPSWEPRA